MQGRAGVMQLQCKPPPPAAHALHLARFTPAIAGTPPTAGSASRCTGPLHEPLGRNALTLQPFSLLRVSGQPAAAAGVQSKHNGQLG